MSRRSLPAKLRAAVLDRDEHRCVACGAAECAFELHLEIDHITPVEMGGDNAIANLRTLCVDCHDYRHHVFDKFVTQVTSGEIAPTERDGRLIEQARGAPRYPLPARFTIGAGV